MPQEMKTIETIKLAIQTETHSAIIESENAHMMGMVHETDVDTYVRE